MTTTIAKLKTAIYKSMQEKHYIDDGTNAKVLMRLVRIDNQKVSIIIDLIIADGLRNRNRLILIDAIMSKFRKPNHQILC